MLKEYVRETLESIQDILGNLLAQMELEQITDDRPEIEQLCTNIEAIIGYCPTCENRRFVTKTFEHVNERYVFPCEDCCDPEQFSVADAIVCALHHGVHGVLLVVPDDDDDDEKDED